MSSHEIKAPAALEGNTPEPRLRLASSAKANA